MTEVAGSNQVEPIGFRFCEPRNFRLKEEVISALRFVIRELRGAIRCCVLPLIVKLFHRVVILDSLLGHFHLLVPAFLQAQIRRLSPPRAP